MVSAFQVTPFSSKKYETNWNLTMSHTKTPMETENTKEYPSMTKQMQPTNVNQYRQLKKKKKSYGK